MLNVDLLESVTLNAGGFGAAWGNRLSSVMEMHLREGSRDGFAAQVNMDMTGFGGVAEGPLADSSASWLLSFRHSYLDLLVHAFSVGNTVAPRMMDGQGKVTIDLSPNDQVNVLEMFSQDRLSTDHATAVENEMMYYGDQNNLQNSAGGTWRHLWGAAGVSHLTLSHTVMKFTETFRDIGSQEILFANRSDEQSLDLRNTNRFALGRSGSIECGVDLRREVSTYDNRFGATTDQLGTPTPEVRILRDLSTTTAGAFASLSVEPVKDLTATAGVRVDHFGSSSRTWLSPRLAVMYKVSDLTTLSAAAGLYVQSLPHVILSQSASTSALREPDARHLVLGVGHLLSEDTRLTIEGYWKGSRHLPVDVAQPQLFLLDEIFTGSTFIGNHAAISDAGEARAYGIEVMLQKKLARDFYGLASLSLGRSQYKALDGVWRDRVFDNRVSFCMEGGYKPNEKWDFSLRWVYGGGVPYTPLDIVASGKINAGVLDASRVNGERLPAYHSLNVRVDRRFNFDRSSLVVYLSAWNVYDRQNVASYFWNKITASPDTEYQFGMLPILGVEYEFWA
ncbi:MAG: TonB-dependent receptor [Ignavibacteriae bacterium]|nr:TonB-dependent receptor [Ignavibacteriota bacterium]